MKLSIIFAFLLAASVVLSAKDVEEVCERVDSKLVTDLKTISETNWLRERISTTISSTFKANINLGLSKVQHLLKEEYVNAVKAYAEDFSVEFSEKFRVKSDLFVSGDTGGFKKFRAGLSMCKQVFLGNAFILPPADEELNMAIKMVFFGAGDKNFKSVRNYASNFLEQVLSTIRGWNAKK